jgi:signal transduction histidine kinase
VRNSPKYWAVAAGIVVGAQMVLSLFVPRSFLLTLTSDIIQTFLLAASMFFLVPNFRSAQGRTRLFWGLMTAGFAFWLVTQILWSYFEVVLRREVPNPFIGDALLFLHIVPMMGAFAMQPQRQPDQRTLRVGSLDFILLLVWWLYLYLYVVIPWQYISFNEPNYGLGFDRLYVIEKLVFLGCLGWIGLRATRAWKNFCLHWFGATLLYSVSALMANIAITHNLYYTGSAYDLPLLISMAWYSWIPLRARELELQSLPEPSARHRGVWPARLAMGAILSMPLLAGWALFDTLPGSVRNYRLIVTLATILLMGFLAFLKQHFLDRELLHLLQSSEESVENLRRLQAQLVQSEKLASLGKLVGGAAHELNNPLTAVLGYAELLSTTQPLTEEQRSLSDKITQHVRRTKALVNSLLSFAKQVPTQKVPVDLNTIARTALTQSKPQMRTRNMEVRTSLAIDLPRIEGDQNQLLQVCLHIINNAVQAMEESGTGLVQVSTRSERDTVVLEFSDSGPGATEPERVFDPFYTTKAVGKGAGLGLSACYGIVEEHGGKISCQNRPEGGAVFRIELPAIRERQAFSSIGAVPSDTSVEQEMAPAALSLPPAPR